MVRDVARRNSFSEGFREAVQGIYPGSRRIDWRSCLCTRDWAQLVYGTVRKHGKKKIVLYKFLIKHISFNQRPIPIHSVGKRKTIFFYLSHINGNRDTILTAYVTSQVVFINNICYSAVQSKNAVSPYVIHIRTTYVRFPTLDICRSDTHFI